MKLQLKMQAYIVKKRKLKNDETEMMGGKGVLRQISRNHCHYSSHQKKGGGGLK